MNASELTADDRSSLADIEQLVANASVAAAKATSNASGLETTEYPIGLLRLAREDVRTSYLKSQRALDRLESLIGHFDDGLEMNGSYFDAARAGTMRPSSGPIRSTTGPSIRWVTW